MSPPDRGQTSASPFRGVKGEVRVAHERVGVAALIGEQGHSGGDAYLDLVALECVRPCQRAQQ